MISYNILIVDIIMPRVNQKRGVVDEYMKTAMQSSIMDSEQGKSAMTPVTKRTKSRIRNPRGSDRFEGSQFTNDNVLRKKLFQGENVNLRPFLEAKGRTGVLKKSEIQSGVSSFVNKLNNMVGFESADLQSGKNKLPKGLVIDQGYQKARYNFNPKKLQLTGGKWSLDIPDSFKKVSDRKFVAPKKRYRRSYDYEREDGERDVDKEYSTYNPAEVLLGDNNRLSKVVERGILTERYEKEEDEDRRTREEDKKPFTTRKQEYYDTGLLRRQQDFGKLDSVEFEKRVETVGGDEERSLEKEQSYKKAQYDFTPEGFLRESREYTPVDTLKRDYKDLDRDSFTEIEEEREQAQLTRSRSYDPESGFLRSGRDFDVIDASEEAYYDDDTSERIVRERAMLRREQLGANPQSFLGSVRQGRSPQPSMVRDFFTVSQTDVDDSGSTEGFTTTKTTIPGRITYYNPLTGEVIDSERLI